MNSNLHNLLSYLKSDRDNVDLNFQVLVSYKQANDVQAALTFIDSMSELVAKDPKIMAATIELFLHYQVYDRALLLAKALLASTDQHRISIHYLLLTYYMSQDFSNVINTVEQYPVEQLDVASVLIACRSYLQLSQIVLAKELLAKLQTASPDVMAMRALIELDLDNVQQANVLADLALAENPKQYEANLVKGTVLVRELDFDRASTFINACLQSMPFEGRALSLAGQHHFYTQNFVEAAQFFEASVKNMANHIGTYHLLGWTYLLLEQIDKCDWAFAQALALNGNFADSHGAVAVAAIHKGQIEAAQKAIKVALRLDPNCATAHYANSLLMSQQGREEEAEQLVNSLLNTESVIAGKSHMNLVAEVLAKGKQG